jgi:ribosomal protein S18 acetylase RimI-like enzyme
MNTANLNKDDKNQFFIEEMLGTGSYRELVGDEKAPDLPYRVTVFDSVTLQERQFGFAEKRGAMTAEALLQGPQIFCLTPEEAPAISSIPTTSRVAAARKACFEIDSAYSEDIATITALDAGQWGRWANTHALYRQLLDVLPSNIKIARGVLGEVLGFGVNLFNSTTKQGWILSVDVAPQYRGLGIGRGIAKALIQELESQGCETITAMIAPDNGASMPLFRSLGFVPEKLERDYFGPGNAQVRLVRQSTCNEKC